MERAGGTVNFLFYFLIHVFFSIYVVSGLRLCQSIFSCLIAPMLSMYVERMLTLFLNNGSQKYNDIQQSRF